jgi:outer membrane lipoprotein carrier protein
LPFIYLARSTGRAAGLALVAALAVGPALQAQGDSASAEAFASRLQKKYDTVRDFTADFTQTYEGGVLRKKTSERGTVQIKKPGRMRWSYTAPEPKLFVADGEKMYSYVPADRQVVVSRVPPADEAATPVLFLVGKGNLTRDFSVSFADVPGAPPGSVALRLLPRQQERDYEWLTLVVDRDTLVLRMLIAGDNQGGTSTFAFTNLKENVGLPDRTFSFTIPRGADVIHQG